MLIMHICHSSVYPLANEQICQPVGPIRTGWTTPPHAPLAPCSRGESHTGDKSSAPEAALQKLRWGHGGSSAPEAGWWPLGILILLRALLIVFILGRFLTLWLKRRRASANTGE